VTSTLLLAAAAHLAGSAKDPPLIDLDSTIFVQLGIFVLTAILLSKFLFKPYLKMRAARSEGIDGARAEATRMDDEATAQITSYDTSFAAARKKASAERELVRAQAAERERAIADAARKQSQGAIEASRATLTEAAATARAQLAPRADEIARSIVKKVLGREVA
jgi:F-type H+-transporting ATPase subunit b